MNPAFALPKLHLRDRLAIYQELSKSGIVALVLISVFGGYLAGQSFERPFDLKLMLTTLLGVLFLASGSSALNQYQEHLIDAEMPRTAKRPLPSGRLSEQHVLGFILVTLGLGVTFLSQINLPVLCLGLVAVVSYNGLYTLWWKKNWAYAAVPGAIPGALPIMMGYGAANHGHLLAPGCLYLFFILFFWQMPHFWALALRYEADYRAGGIPTLPVARGGVITLNQIVIWCLAYVALALIAPVFLQVGGGYCLVTFAMSIKLLWELRKFVRAPESRQWLHFFLWINFSLVAYIGAAVGDLWSVYLIPYFNR